MSEKLLTKPFLQRNNFWLLWTATAASNLADGIFKLALPLLAVTMTTSPTLVAGVALAVRLPWLFFALFAGVLADRFDRRRIMIHGNWVRVVALLLLVVTIALKIMSLPVLYLCALVLGIAETLADTAASAVIPSVVASKDLEKANMRLVGVTTITNEFVGPPLGGFLVGIGFALAFATSSAFYLVAAVAIGLMVGTTRPNPAKQKSIWKEMGAGWRFVWHDSLLRTLVIMVAVMNMGWSAWLSLMALYLVKPGGLSEVGYGVMLTGIGIGGLLGTALVLPMTQRFGRTWVIAGDILGTFCMLVVPALTTNVWAIGIAAALGGMGGAMWSVVVTAIRQQVVPDEMQGKVSGVFRLFGYGALPVGSALAGMVAELSEIPMAFMLCAILTLWLLLPFQRTFSKGSVTTKLEPLPSSLSS